MPPWDGVSVGLGEDPGLFWPPGWVARHRLPPASGSSVALGGGGRRWQLGPHRGRDVPGGVPTVPVPRGWRKEPGERHAQTYKSVPSLQRDHMRFLFHKTEDGISIVLAGDVLQRGSRFHPLSSSPQRRSLSLCQGDPSHPGPPPATKFGSAGRSNPPRRVLATGITGTAGVLWLQSCSLAATALGALGRGGPRGVAGTPREGDSPFQVPPGADPRVPRLPAAGLLPNFHNQLTNEGLTPPKPNDGSLGAGDSPGSLGMMPPSRLRSPARSKQLLGNAAETFAFGSGAPSLDPLSIPQPGPTRCV